MSLARGERSPGAYGLGDCSHRASSRAAPCFQRCGPADDPHLPVQDKAGHYLPGRGDRSDEPPQMTSKFSLCFNFSRDQLPGVGRGCRNNRSRGWSGPPGGAWQGGLTMSGTANPTLKRTLSPARRPRLPLVVYVLTLRRFLMLTQRVRGCRHSSADRWCPPGGCSPGWIADHGGCYRHGGGRTADGDADDLPPSVGW